MTSDMSDVIRFISDRIGDYDEPEYLNKWAAKAMKELPSCRYSLLGRKSNSMSRQMAKVLDKVEKLEGFSLMEKLQLAFIFSRPVSDGFVQMLKDANFEINQDEKKRIRRFSTEDGSIFRFSDHNQRLKNFEGVLCLNGLFQKKVNKMEREKEQDQQDMEYDNTGSEMTEGPETMEEMQEETDEEVMEDPTGNIPIELVPKQEVDDYSDFGGYVSQGAFNGPINYEELDNQNFVYPGFPQTARPATSIRVQKRRQSSTTVIGKRVKTQEIASGATSSDSITTSSNLEAAPAKSVKVSTTSSNALSTVEATSTGTTQDEPIISVMSLVTHIETIAIYYDLESLQRKASLAIRKMRESGENKTLSVAKFNSLIDALLICIEENRTRQNETSIPLKSILKHLQLHLIRPLGSEEALESISQKIKEFVNEDDGVPPNLISESLAHLLMTVGFYNQLE
ncbi:hypothetical protein B9Z55_021184 [Caenorhabditis nigoni]|uniref:SPK domain-containing protein n=1 Tax=Caenorhabditis nigoni TaxID=1611254 RepID=A0A2G5TR01_9PELO|nr:hypothetical protein B9Z55_021184 [Caenorhabditis nigoni]